MKGREKIKSLGEKRIRTDFDEGYYSAIDRIKQKTAELVNEVEKLKTKDSESIRLACLAQTHFETAAMFAVKAATA